MLASALKSPTAIRVVETGALSHFVTLDDRKWIPSFDTIPSSEEAERIKQQQKQIRAAQAKALISNG
ncbi:hypothetical protein A3742_16810 [Oleiphilus sp. HI0071]|nr:hypothetical protein A3742_16810 [Oleiphilus sp. HI0071]